MKNELAHYLAAANRAAAAWENYKINRSERLMRRYIRRMRTVGNLRAKLQNNVIARTV